MATTLTIGGTTVNRTTQRVALDRMTISLDSYDRLEFHQYACGPVPLWTDGTAVTCTDPNGNPLFSGQIAGVSHGMTPLGWQIGYTANGLKYVGNQIPFVNWIDQSGSLTYNLPPDDPDYVQSMAGLSVGTMIANILTNHAAALSAAGIAGFVAADLTPLTIVPTRAVTFAGPHLFDVLDQLLDQWSAVYALTVAYDSTTSDWRVRVLDTRAFTPQTLTLGTDPIDPPSMRRDSSSCFTRVLVRGHDLVEPAYHSLGDGTLLEGFTSTDKSNWSESSFTAPAGAIDEGTISVLASNQATCTSSSASETWATNQWSGAEAWIYLVNPAATGIAQFEARAVTANSSMLAGGTGTVNWNSAIPLVNSGYTNYKLIGQPSGLSNCWRLYNLVVKNVANTAGPTNPNPSYDSQHMVRRSPLPVPWRATDQAVAMTNYPAACIVQGGVEMPATFELLPNTYQIRFSQPVVNVFGTPANLQAGGSQTDGIPDDIKVLILYSRGTLTAVEPPDVSGSPQYQGTAYTADGIQRTYYLDVPSWIYAGDLSQMQALAQMYLDSLKNTVIEGAVVYHGYWSSAFPMGVALNIAGNNGSAYTTGWESIACPIREVTIEYGSTDGSPDLYRTILRLNNRRRPMSGSDLYVHPLFQGMQAWLNGGHGLQGGGSLPLGTMGGLPGMGGPVGGLDALDGGESGPSMDDWAGMLGGMLDEPQGAPQAPAGASSKAFVDVGLGPKGTPQPPPSPLTAAVDAALAGGDAAPGTIGGLGPIPERDDAWSQGE